MSQPDNSLQGKVAVFAGTREGRLACMRLVEAGVRADAYVATDYGARVLRDICGLHIYVGRLCEDDMLRLLGQYRAVLDATHPYAAVASANIESSCALLAIPVVRIGRPRVSRDDLAGLETHVVASPREAAGLLSKTTGNVLLTTGSKDLAAYAGDEGLLGRVWARIIPDADNLRQALDLGYKASHLICMQGPFSVMLNYVLMLEHDIRWIVTKDSGAIGGLPQKLEAARQAKAGVILIDRPSEEGEGLTVDEAVRRVIGLVSGQADAPAR